MNTDPSLVGYWAEVHKLSTEDLQEDPQFQELTGSWSTAQYRAYRQGRVEAREELKQERREHALAELRSSLREAASS